jgi:cysteine-rich repeat protein
MCGDGYNPTLIPYKGNNLPLNDYPTTGYCEDGNRFLYGDGCDRNCEFQPGFTLWLRPAAPAFPQEFTEDCNDFATKVHGYHSCEDGNLILGDGCSPTCDVTFGWECGQGDPIEWDDCKEICGDGHDFFTYECDDGNLVSGDGCSQICTIERGYQCD